MTKNLKMENFCDILKNTTKIREIILKIYFLESQNNQKLMTKKFMISPILNFHLFVLKSYM
jgi:hypothetical protein